MSIMQREMTIRCVLASEGGITGSLRLSKFTHTDNDSLSPSLTYGKMSVCSTEMYTF